MSKDEQVPDPSRDEIRQNWADWKRDHDLDYEINRGHTGYPWRDTSQDRGRDQEQGDQSNHVNPQDVP